MLDGQLIVLIGHADDLHRAPGAAQKEEPRRSGAKCIAEGRVL
jgi:hypothetical protein